MKSEKVLAVSGKPINGELKKKREQAGFLVRRRKRKIQGRKRVKGWPFELTEKREKLQILEWKEKRAERKEERRGFFFLTLSNRVFQSLLWMVLCFSCFCSHIFGKGGKVVLLWKANACNGLNIFFINTNVHSRCSLFLHYFKCELHDIKALYACVRTHRVCLAIFLMVVGLD